MAPFWALYDHSNGTAHFRRWEFECPDCGTSGAHPALLDALEALRSTFGGPIEIISGFRCPTHNANVGGALESQHLYGTAADLRTVVPFQLARDLRVFGGIGRDGDRALHVDVRHVVPDLNSTGGTVDAPSLWDY